ncbi:ankyrin repeat domain-containing protein [Vibrio nigripulchritudo]|uniref:ankyrin repeat domain-containing protein n=1 Tax=Vibrio nigripulchritudo TaxID=28173 RepID=UPI00061E2250|nr:ankyrin repeat domain-containing protein [Vibrio nigripulchritudo]KJY73663.1 ankyrin [Vibrio nigripulchritudo]
MKKWGWLLIAGLLALSMAAKGDLMNIFGSKPYADAFFEGDMLNIAKAIKKKDGEMITKLGKAIEDIDAPGKHGMTLLGFAVNDENPVAIKTLMALGADPSIELPELGSVAYHAMWRKSDEPLKALLESGMDPNLRDEEDTLIFNTPALEQSNAMQLLVEYGADVNARDTLGNTPLIHILPVRFDDSLYLLNHGADPYAMNNEGISVAYSVQEELEHMDQSSEAYQKMLKIQQKLVEKGVKFPALTPFGERFRNGIVFCKEPHGYMPKAECKVEGVNEFLGEQTEQEKRLDEKILKERFGIEHRF